MCAVFIIRVVRAAPRRAPLINDMMARRNIQVPINQYFCFTAHVAEIKKDA
jgi:hypothetical protein